MREKLDTPETKGAMQIRLEAAREHINCVRGCIHRLGYSEEETKRTLHHLEVADAYVNSVWQAMTEKWGNTDGQLCPNKKCAHDLAFPNSGWWKCPNCKEDFYARISDSEVEDYHCYSKGEGYPPKPDEVPIARHIGPSWATPE